MNVTKRDGRQVDFDLQKISDAVSKAMSRTTNIDPQLPQLIAQKVSKKITSDTSVEQIQDLVEHFLMTSSRKDVAVQYIRYRERRSVIRRQNSKFMGVIKSKIEASNIQNQNANVEQASFGGRKGQAASQLMKQYALDYCMSQQSKYNHENNMIYIHDLDSYALGEHNCLSIPFDDLLKNGFNTRQTDVRPANSINTAFQLIAVIFQLQSLQQFGGVSATHLDWTMVPYVRKSFLKHFNNGLKYIENDIELSADEKEFYSDASIEYEGFKQHNKAYQYAMDMTEKELKQAVEGMFHNLK